MKVEDGAVVTQEFLETQKFATEGEWRICIPVEKVDKETFMAKFKEIFNRYNIDSVKKDNKEDKVEFNRTDINFAVSEFIKYCYETGIYTDEDIKKINEMDKETLTNHVYSDPRFVEFEQMRTEWAKDQQEEKGKGL